MVTSDEGDEELFGIQALTSMVREPSHLISLLSLLNLCWRTFEIA
jgi:hypothetical protein